MKFFTLGAFGSGAAFALEDSWILARAFEHSQSDPEPIKKALEIFDSIRSPYYLRMSVIFFYSFFPLLFLKRQMRLSSEEEEFKS